MHLYLDDSGTRHPDRDPGQMPAHGRDWFALGGVIVREPDEEPVRTRHQALADKWSLGTTPLHSFEIRGRSQRFHWLDELSKEKLAEFMNDLSALATMSELTTIACVIDRPGYNERYREKYPEPQHWLLCKTAFNIVVERAVKWANVHGCKLRVYVEQADKVTDKIMRGYYDDLRTVGPPFDPNNSQKYDPAALEVLRSTLYDFKQKNKSSQLMQIADLVLWPMCIGGYDGANHAYAALRNAGVLIDCKLDAVTVAMRGIKYSCFDKVAPRT